MQLCGKQKALCVKGYGCVVAIWVWNWSVLSYVCIAVQEHWRCPEDLWGGPHICPMRSGLGWGWGAPCRGFTPEGQEEDLQRPFGGVLQWQPWDWRMPGVRGLDCLINCSPAGMISKWMISISVCKLNNGNFNLQFSLSSILSCQGSSWHVNGRHFVYDSLLCHECLCYHMLLPSPE